MTCLVTNSQTASARTWHSVPISVKEHFSLEKSTDYNPKKFNIAVSFSGEWSTFSIRQKQSPGGVL